MLVILSVIPPLAIVFAVNKYCGTERCYIRRFVLIFLIAGLLIAAAAMFGSDFLTRGAGTLLGSGFLFVLVSNFITVALFEESLKYIVLRWRFVKRDPFTEPLYAIALSVTVSMGFAFYEQMVYTLGEGLITVILRAILSVPGHTGHAILMGMLAGKRKFLRLALLVPALTHGTYDFIVGLYRLYGSDLFILLLVAFTAGLLYYTIRLLRRVKHDSRGNSGGPDTAAITDDTNDIPEVFYE